MNLMKNSNEIKLRTALKFTKQDLRYRIDDDVYSYACKTLLWSLKNNNPIDLSITFIRRDNENDHNQYHHFVTWFGKHYCGFDSVVLSCLMKQLSVHYQVVVKEEPYYTNSMFYRYCCSQDEALTKITLIIRDKIDLYNSVVTNHASCIKTEHTTNSLPTTTHRNHFYDYA